MSCLGVQFAKHANCPAVSKYWQALGTHFVCDFSSAGVVATDYIVIAVNTYLRKLVEIPVALETCDFVTFCSITSSTTNGN